MDSNGHTNFKQLNRIAVSRSAAILIILVFLTTVVTTGLLVYHFASCSKAAYSHHTAGGDTITHPTDCPTTTTTTTTSSHPASVSPPAAGTPLLPPPVTESVTTTTEVPPAPEDAVKNVRLPTSVVPVAYTLALVPFIYENFSFSGDVRILVNVTEATDNVTLHAVDLDVDVETVYVREYAGGVGEGEDLSGDSGQQVVQVPIERTSNDSARQFFVVHLGRSLEEGKQYVVGMKFVGVLNDLLQGFYRSSYMVGNETRWIAATQFQATDARRAFPCFDEPALKATFKISLARPANMSTISNMPKLERSEAVANISNYVWDHYPVSVPMSTYLVAFIVSDFEHITNGTLSIWARKSAINQARFGLEIGPSILKYYEEYFQIKFPLPKIDMIALPDFSAGAMENWGLITYRESVLLYEEGISTVYNLQGISVVIAHELAHQWFGNLVTPSWWSDLWLNEGFASYLENIGTNSVRPEWRMMDQFVVHDLQNVFALDALSASHQISIEVENPDEINEIFDRISYAKGATIIRMMEHFLTTAVFKQGLTNFLNAKKYGSATQDDLWEALTLEGHKQDTLHPSLSVKSIMDTWTLQTGYPVVTVTRNYDTNTADLSQNKFSLNEDVTNSTLKWWIPITYTTPSIPLNNSWISSTQDSIEISDIKKDDWLLVNVNETGYYRVNYDQENWLKLTKELMNKSEFVKTFDPKNRAQMLDDCLNLALAGYLDYDIALNVTRYLVNERDYVPWKAAFNAFDFFSERFMRTGHFDKLKKYMKYLMGDLYNALGFKGHAKDTQLETYLRKETLTRSCLMGHVDCVHDSVVMYQNWRITPDPDRNNPIPPNLKILVYCTAIQIGNQEEWDFAWERFLNANVGSEREILMSALGCSRETWILSRYLEWTITPGSGIRKQDAFRVFGSVTDNIIGQDLAFRFLKGNWDRIRKYMGSSILGLNGIVRAVTSKLSAREDVEELKLFASNRSSELGPAARTIQQSVEQVEANLRWMDTYYDKIVTWLTITNNYNDVISINQT